MSAGCLSCAGQTDPSQMYAALLEIKQMLSWQDNDKKNNNLMGKNNGFEEYFFYILLGLINTDDPQMPEYVFKIKHQTVIFQSECLIFQVPTLN